MKTEPLRSAKDNPSRDVAASCERLGNKRDASRPRPPDRGADIVCSEIHQLLRMVLKVLNYFGLWGSNRTVMHERNLFNKRLLSLFGE